MVHRKVAELPTTNPVTVDVGDPGVVTVAVPATTLQVPTPTAGAFAANVVAVVSHKSWSGPALATVGASSILITTSSVDVPHTPFDIVHLSVTEEPTTSPVTPEEGDEGVVTVAVPDTTDHSPVPTVGLFPASVAMVTLHRF